MRRSVLLTMMMAVLTAFNLHAKTNRLIDAETKSALPLASIIDHQGNVIGMTGDDGEIPHISANRFPVTFTYMGYEPLVITELGDADVEMYQRLYELPEIVVSPGSRPLLHLIGYMREVASVLGSSESITVFKESIVDYLVPIEDTKVKGWDKPRELASKIYVRMSDYAGLDSVSNELNQDVMLWGNKLARIPLSKKIPQSMKGPEPVAVDTIMGKYSPKHIWVKNGEVTRLYSDGLADNKNHVKSPWALKLLGGTADFKEVSSNYVFRTEASHELRPIDMTSMSLSIDIIFRGKIFKREYDSTKPVDLRTYIELYLTDRDFLTEEEGRELKKEVPAVGTSEVIAPQNVPALHPGVKQIVDRVNALR